MLNVSVFADSTQLESDLEGLGTSLKFIDSQVSNLMFPYVGEVNCSIPCEGLSFKSVTLLNFFFFPCKIDANNLYFWFLRHVV